MKKILITGANSYIGTSFDKYIKKNHLEDYVVDTIDMVDGSWREKSFAGYDIVFHVAGIAHSDNGRLSKEKERLYYKVNTELAIETANKAKEDGVAQFIYMSSAIVYGESAPIGKSKMIDKDTPLSPNNCYSDSKAQAEKGLEKLKEATFKIVILRPPMIYGKGSKGNYPLLAKLAKKCPVFPYVENQRSMIYIENFCEFVRLMVQNEEDGVFCPQNNEYSNTSEIVKMISEVCGKKVYFVRGLGLVIKILGKYVKYINKAFGNLSYDFQLSKYKEEYCLYSLKESIQITEGKGGR